MSSCHSIDEEQRILGRKGASLGQFTPIPIVQCLQLDPMFKRIIKSPKHQLGNQASHHMKLRETRHSQNRNRGPVCKREPLPAPHIVPAPPTLPDLLSAPAFLRTVLLDTLAKHTALPGTFLKYKAKNCLSQVKSPFSLERAQVPPRNCAQVPPHNCKPSLKGEALTCSFYT